MDADASSTLDKTTLSTISLLEARLLRIEHILHGPSTTPVRSGPTSAIASLAELEHRFSKLLSDVRVYADLLRIYKSHPELFTSDPQPSDLPDPALRATVLASASSYPLTASALTAIRDTPIPAPDDSAKLAALAPRMKAVEITQMAQAAEVADLRRRSEQVVRWWYENGVVENSEFVERIERRVAKVEQGVRRRERAAEESD